jgi:hypothetical protein
MNVRNAAYHDVPVIKILLEVLGYKTTTSILVSQLVSMSGKDDHQVFMANKVRSFFEQFINLVG